VRIDKLNRLGLFGRRLMISLQLVSQGPLFGVLRIVRIDGICRFFAYVGNAEQFGLGVAPADGEIECAVRADGRIRQRQRGAREELFLDRLVAAAFRLQMHGEDGSEGPIEQV